MKFVLDIQLFASKKGVGSTKNGRDSHSKRLGAKLADGQFAHAGSIIYRQRGTKIHPGRQRRRRHVICEGKRHRKIRAFGKGQKESFCLSAGIMKKSPLRGFYF